MYTNDQKVVIISITSACFLVGVLVYFIKTFNKQHNKITSWQQARIKAEVEILENERKRIAKDLHDELGTFLSAIKFQVNQLKPTTETEEIIISKSSNQIDDVIQKFRNISYNLLPNTLVRKGLVAATKEFISRVENNITKINFQSIQLNIETETSINIFRIIQEIIHNTLKHSRATKLDINIYEEGGNYIISTKDDGIGFTYNIQTQINNGLGLLSLESRVTILGGKLNIDTAVGRGVKYFIIIPQKKYD